ncbi:dynamin family protein [Actinomycetospora endophytica]|uniref:Dynamin family protein n=1 Tax=Actinomycetospora endophytica TaxID=2291215 RepID=A0ABS8PBD5_9PSEU|nr:dynamin family protein [Actinomycetospora endophytica]MCD2195528.1 dynamin family protein [Actinomycetospora endophytica]
MSPEATGVVPAVGALLAEAVRVYAGSPAERELRAVAARIREPLRVAIAGRVKAGKSTLLNALVGQELAATDAGECTRLVTWYVDGTAYRVDLQPYRGAPRQLPFRQRHGSLDIDLGDVRAEQVERLIVTWPSPMLRRTTLIDTPGIGSVNTEVSDRSERVLAPEDGEVTAADAVVYLMRHAHGDDVRFLEAFRDGAVDRRTVNTIAVLSRCDEIGHARPDALTTAARIADRYRLDPRVRALCQTVVPVAGLLASSAASLREAEYRAVVALAAAEDTDRMLLSAARFESADSDTVSTTERTTLLARYGMFGVRTAIRLVREGGVTNATDLARELTKASGMRELQHLLATQFGARADVLKARSALSALDGVIRRHPVPAARGLVHQVERVQSGAHEFAEIALIDDLRSRRVLLPESELHDAERLLGGEGMDAATRLGLDAQADGETVRRVAAEQHLRWQRRAENPAATRERAQAARVLVRTCEGILSRRPAEYSAAAPAPGGVGRYS